MAGHVCFVGEAVAGKVTLALFDLFQVTLAPLKEVRREFAVHDLPAFSADEHATSVCTW